jgi:hypothetical protein
LKENYIWGGWGVNIEGQLRLGRGLKKPKKVQLHWSTQWTAAGTRDRSLYDEGTCDMCIRLTNDRPDLSSERAPKKEIRQKTSDINLLKGNNIWSQIPDLARHQDVMTDCQSQNNSDSDMCSHFLAVRLTAISDLLIPMFLNC